MLLAVEDVLVEGIGYAQRLTDERQYVNGREVMYVVDHELKEIRYSVHVTALFKQAHALASATAISAGPAQVGPPVILGPWVRVSGCYLCRRKLWPWEESRLQDRQN